MTRESIIRSIPRIPTSRWVTWTATACNIVFFGEDVPNLSRAADIMETADIVVVIGTSLNVYPAASLLRYAPAKAPIWLIDPKPVHSPYREVTQIQKGASEGMKELDKILRG